MNADGTGKRKLTSDAYANITPSWSLDGKLIAFSSDRVGNPNYEIYVMRPDGSMVRRLTYWRGVDTDPDWSPDGRYIVFDHNFALFVMNADGTAIVPIPHIEGVEIHLLHGVEEEPGEMVLGQPVLEAWGQQVGLVSVAREEVEGHRISSGERTTCL